MQTIGLNLSRKNETLRIYELGTVFFPKALPLVELPEERLQLVGALLGQREEQGWNQASAFVDFYDAKGTVEELLVKLGINDFAVSVGEHFAMHPGKTAVFSNNGQTIANVGELHPLVQEAYGINRKIYVFELDMLAIIAQASLLNSYCALPKFPAINRDLAVVLARETPAAKVTEVISANAGPLLETVKLFDVYSGEQVQSGMRSLAFALTFRAADRTLTDEEIEGYFNTIVTALEQDLSAKLRFI